MHNSSERKTIRLLLTVLAAMLIAAMLPASSFASDGSKSGKSIKASSLKPHVLIVDNTAASDELKKMLEKEGLEVTKVYKLRLADPEKYDGLIIPGGHNIDPEIYHAKRSPYTYGTNIRKDRKQIKAIKRFARAGKPILGICRGCQVINVAFGGTIKQHIGWHKRYREVRNVKGYWMYEMYGKTRNTYHFHHQAVKRLGKHLIATSYDAASGEIESIQHETLPVYGIQWHPETKGRRVFIQFRKICQRKMKEELELEARLEKTE